MTHIISSTSSLRGRHIGCTATEYWIGVLSLITAISLSWVTTPYCSWGIIKAAWCKTWRYIQPYVQALTCLAFWEEWKIMAKNAISFGSLGSFRLCSPPLIPSSFSSHLNVPWSVTLERKHNELNTKSISNYLRTSGHMSSQAMRCSHNPVFWYHTSSTVMHIVVSICVSDTDLPWKGIRLSNWASTNFAHL